MQSNTKRKIGLDKATYKTKKVKSIQIISERHLLVTYDKIPHYVVFKDNSKGTFKEWKIVKTSSINWLQYHFPFVVSLFDLAGNTQVSLYHVEMKDPVHRKIGNETEQFILLLCDSIGIVVFSRTCFYWIDYEKFFDGDEGYQVVHKLEEVIDGMPSTKYSAISEDLILVGSQLDIFVYNITTGKCLLKRNSPEGLSSVSCVRKSSDSAKVFGHDYNYLYIWSNDEPDIKVMLSAPLSCLVPTG